PRGRPKPRRGVRRARLPRACRRPGALLLPGPDRLRPRPAPLGHAGHPARGRPADRGRRPQPRRRPLGQPHPRLAGTARPPAARQVVGRGHQRRPRTRPGRRGQAPAALRPALPGGGPDSARPPPRPRRLLSSELDAPSLALPLDLFSGEPMPTYEYVCTECGDHTEVVRSFADAPLTTCTVCGGPLRKVFSPVGIVFKGSGFYRTDSRGTSRRPAHTERGKA